jgi:probable F420-dependent oxidoreductase
MSNPTPRFGIITPIVTLFRRSENWETTAGPRELREIAIAADQLGYEYLTCSEHVGIPSDVEPIRGGRYYDPLATFGFMAALTERVRFLTNVLVLPYHHPLAVAKRYGTLDRMCEGRLMLGVGVGSLEPEFELLGAEFAGRGDRYGEALEALRACWAQRQPAFHGKYYDFDDFIIDPCAVNAQIPIWLGGRTPRSLRRALVSGDGWNPFSLSVNDVAALVRRASEWPEWKERREPLDIALAPDGAADVTQPGGVERFCAAVERTLEAGATVINVTPRADSLEHYLEQLEGVAREVMPRFVLA